jgi:hypothetical protein
MGVIKKLAIVIALSNERRPFFFQINVVPSANSERKEGLASRGASSFCRAGMRMARRITTANRKVITSTHRIS